MNDLEKRIKKDGDALCKSIEEMLSEMQNWPDEVFNLFDSEYQRTGFNLLEGIDAINMLVIEMREFQDLIRP